MLHPIDFFRLPKQWLISSSEIGAPVGGRRETFSGLHIAAADSVPLVRILDAAGNDVGRLIGWVIDSAYLYCSDTTISLQVEESPESLYSRLAGRFVMVWRGSDGALRLREDSAGGLPAIYVPDAGVVGATVSVLDNVVNLPPDPDVEGIFSFPDRNGFLPFGLTPRRGAYRLMPNHVLDLDSFDVTRVWPNLNPQSHEPVVKHGKKEGVAEAAEILRRQVGAILSTGETIINLSGGYDSRLILAAAKGHTEYLRAETFGEKTSLDAHLARKLASRAGINHRVLAVVPSSPTEITEWLNRSGRMMCDAVTSMGGTVAKRAPAINSMSGTGADLIQGTPFQPSDIGAPIPTSERLLSEYYLPHHPILVEAGERWISDLARHPSMDASIMLDLTRIEQRHGCWAGSAVYGHPTPMPSLQPFGGQRLYEISLGLPRDYVVNRGFYRDLIGELWPELGEIPINRGAGFGRLRYWRKEISNALPGSAKHFIKRIAQK
ncbi:asparagine synthase-related protein [Spiribacter vilamensis]|uniref:Asparagine synthase n=1 Tax=Spiribacter vilamensis TaxID=531306 RepID=A0A4Q8CZB8_9GAMM|nr:asparagine synthase-related protein [Spiribacter vilamensis]RZU98371.1 asparagine synthase [Spiribacter vilamensis]TVO60747.1 hypothetical protein FPL09_00845 [Spiribacter vilamensis]